MFGEPKTSGELNLHAPPLGENCRWGARVGKGRGVRAGFSGMHAGCWLFFRWRGGVEVKVGTIVV